MQYIIYAKRLEFRPNEERHPAATMNRMKDGISLLGNLQAVIDPSLDNGIKRLAEMARQYAGMFIDVRDGKARVSDFKLVLCHGKLRWDDHLCLTGTADSPGSVVSDLSPYL